MMVRNAGIGPASYAWEAHVLPLNQFRLFYILPKIKIFATNASRREQLSFQFDPRSQRY